MKYETYNANAHLYKIMSVKTIHDNTDNVDDEIANSLLFGKGPNDKIIFLKKSIIMSYYLVTTYSRNMVANEIN